METNSAEDYEVQKAIADKKQAIEEQKDEQLTEALTKETEISKNLTVYPPNAQFNKAMRRVLSGIPTITHQEMPEIVAYLLSVKPHFRMKAVVDLGELLGNVADFWDKLDQETEGDPLSKYALKEYARWLKALEKNNGFFMTAAIPKG